MVKIKTIVACHSNKFRPVESAELTTVYWIHVIKTSSTPCLNFSVSPT